jgi:hypothetical protein
MIGVNCKGDECGVLVLKERISGWGFVVHVCSVRRESGYGRLKGLECRGTIK